MTRHKGKDFKVNFYTYICMYIYISPPKEGTQLMQGLLHICNLCK